jgi:hypothetical protein
MSGRFQPEAGADSAQSLADAIALMWETCGGQKCRCHGPSICPDCGCTTEGTCIACSERAEPTSVWCRYHRLRVEEEAAL